MRSIGNLLCFHVSPHRKQLQRQLRRMLGLRSLISASLRPHKEVVCIDEHLRFHYKNKTHFDFRREEYEN